VAGTIATLLFAVMFGGKYPHYMDWVGLALILVAVAFMTKAEKRRARELAQEELGFAQEELG
jgi:drug/metabolite transporter (DMT)-like permease